jgi:hypothetical protein
MANVLNVVHVSIDRENKINWFNIITLCGYARHRLTIAVEFAKGMLGTDGHKFSTQHSGVRYKKKVHYESMFSQKHFIHGFTFKAFCVIPKNKDIKQTNKNIKYTKSAST